MRLLKYIFGIALLTMTTSCADEWRDDVLKQVEDAQPEELPDPVMGEPLKEVPFHKGVNINGWLDYALSRIDKNKIKDWDIDNIKKLGMDVVRLPINFHSNVGPGPEYKLDETYLSYIDHAVDLITSRGLWVILDHHSLSVETFTRDSENLVTECCRQLALRYKGKDKIVLEIFNEPFGRDLQQYWPAIQGRILKAVRHCDPNLIMIATGWGCKIYNLQDLPEYNDPRVIYTFHYYDPSMFTHQGAYWSENEGKLSGIPFPYDASRMPEIHPWWQKTPYLSFLYGRYPEDATEERIKKDIDWVVNWGREHNKLLFCGEFGVLNTAEPADRYRWYKALGDALNGNNIAWTLWQYNDLLEINFSIFQGAQIMEQLDVDMMNALGVTVPPEYTGGPMPLTFYSDNANRWCNMRTDLNGGSRYLDYDCTDNPADGPKCIRYFVFSTSGGVLFESTPSANLQKLYDKGGCIEFMARTTYKFKSLEIRLQQKKDGAPRQWRMSATISSNGNSAATRQLTPDGEWHKITIPLSEFNYHGCEGQWKEKPGDGEAGFEWGYVNQLMITPDNDRTAAGKTIYFDEITIK